MLERWKIAVLSIAIAASPLLGCASALRGRVYVSFGPPPPREEVVVAAPGPDFVWIRGHWAWRDRAYVWVPGRWVRRDDAHHWVEGHWVRDRYGWYYVEGHWR